MTNMARLVVTLSFLAAAPHICRAEFIFLGPTPYKSAADSPFPVDGSNANFFLEDFEDGLLNTPGVTITPSGPSLAIIGPSSTTDSVDGDDGVIDGSGVAGWALQRRMAATDMVFPPNYQAFFRFTFSATELGFLPSAIGFVWTDSPAPANVSIILTDVSLRIIDGTTYVGLGDSSDRGETDEDRFIGAIGDRPFATALVVVSFRASPDDPGTVPHLAELDHVQYGLYVPEPGTSVMLSGVGIVFALVSQGRPRVTNRLPLEQSQRPQRRRTKYAKTPLS